MLHVLIQYSLYIILGMFAGMLSGLFGVGGGIIVVPGFIALFEASHFSPNSIMHTAAGTSLAVMIFTASFSAYAHYRRGATFDFLPKMIPGLIVGTAIGSVAGFYLHSEVLEVLFGLLLLWVSFREFFLSRSAKQSIAQSEKNKGVKNWLIVLGTAPIGILSGLLGVGGGTLLVPFLQRSGLDIRLAMSTSAACGFVVALIGTICFILVGYQEPNLPPYSLGFVYLPAVLGVSLSSPFFAFVGTALHHRMPVPLLRRFFSVFLFVVGIKLLV